MSDRHDRRSRMTARQAWRSVRRSSTKSVDSLNDRHFCQLGARTLGFSRGTNGVTPQARAASAVHRDVRCSTAAAALRRVAGLRAIRTRAETARRRRPSRHRRHCPRNGLGGSREVSAEAPGSMIVDFDPERPHLFGEHLEKPSTPHLAARSAATDRADASPHGRELEDPARS